MNSLGGTAIRDDVESLQARDDEDGVRTRQLVVEIGGAKFLAEVVTERRAGDPGDPRDDFVSVDPMEAMAYESISGYGFPRFGLNPGEATRLFEAADCEAAGLTGSYLDTLMEGVGEADKSLRSESTV